MDELPIKISKKDFYPDSVGRYAFAPVFAGRLDAFDASGADASFVCGSFVRFEIGFADGAITEIRYRTNGCGFLIAAAEIACGLASGRSLTELHGLAGIEAAIMESLGDLPDNREHCITTAINGLRAAFRDLRRRRIEEFRGETALVCTCFGVSETEIENSGAVSVEEVGRSTNAGTGCGSCRMLIEEILRQSN